MTVADGVVVTLIGLMAGLGGALLGGGVAAVIGALVGIAAGFLAVRAGVRPVVALVVSAGAIGGALAGDGIVRALCFPGSCPGLATTASALTGLGALIGVGLVTALVARSFDEYRLAEAVRRVAALPPELPTEEAPAGGGPVDRTDDAAIDDSWTGDEGGPT
jgi:hypothetical protein